MTNPTLWSPIVNPQRSATIQALRDCHPPVNPQVHSTFHCTMILFNIRTTCNVRIIRNTRNAAAQL
ncbi:unnamed protein product [Periconia digitata]|uniref:Uncharacterized protein n=1 Tax=Periconia digitata TaxID=1303443 RepID=A0A9W4UUM8_9PLEO|nr:unnamed protein product [Periconia digitata]